MQPFVQDKEKALTGGAASSSLASQLAGFFRFVGLSSDGDFLREVTDLDLSLGQLKIVSHLYELPTGEDAGSELSVKKLGEQLGLSLPTASRALDPLVRRRLVARNEDADDRRVKRVRLTARGQALVERLAAKRVASFEAVLEKLDESEREKLAVAMSAIASRPEIQRHCPRKAAR